MYPSAFRLLRSVRLASHPLAKLSGHPFFLKAKTKKPSFDGFFDFAFSAPYKTAENFFLRKPSGLFCLMN